MTPLTLEQEPPIAAVPQAETSRMISLEEAATFLEISPKHAWELAQLGRLPCQQKGHGLSLSFGDVLEYKRLRDLRREREQASPLYEARKMIAASGMCV